MGSWRGNRGHIAALVLRIVLAAVFFYAAYTKLSQPWVMFAIAIDAYHLLPEGAVVMVARTLPWFELLIGLLLLSGVLPRISSALATAVLLGFFVILVRSYVKGLDIECGCFGLGDKLSSKTLARDGGLLAGSMALTALAWMRRE
jgi:uncharacterized membrane protein YphA (DoxX/SURF4 family)